MSIINLTLAARCIIHNYKNDIPTHIEGPPGVGKSQMMYQVTNKLDIGFMKYILSLRDPVDLLGLPMPNEKSKTTHWLVPDNLPQVKRDGKKGILFLDEMNTASPAVQVAAMGLVLERRLGEYVLPDGWVPMAAGNRMLDRAAAQRMNTALKNRFAHFEVGFELEAWVEWAESVNLSPVMIGWSKFRTELMHKMPNGDEKAFPTPRSWEQVAKHIKAPVDIRQHLVASLVGDGPAAEFEAFISVYEKLVGIIDQALKAPAKAKIPEGDDPGLKYALASALSRRVDKATFGNALIYGSRLPKEYEILIATEAVRKNPALKETKAFATWIVNNNEVMI